MHNQTAGREGRAEATLLLIGIQLLAQGDTELLSQTVHVLQILLVLILVLDLGLDACVSVSGGKRGPGRQAAQTFEDAHGGGEVVDATGGLEGGG
jgi:hypothetical protein